MTRVPAKRWAWLAAVLLTAGCGTVGGGGKDVVGWSGPPRLEAGGALRVLWVERLSPELQGLDGPFTPLQRAVPALDPRRDRIYVGSTEGELRAFTSSGHQEWEYVAGAAIEAAAALTEDGEELYVPDSHGSVHALNTQDGSLRWKDDAGDAIRQAPVIGEDAVYVVTDADRLVALARQDGSVLWEYEREIPDGFSITTRAAPVMDDDQLLAAFTDGAVVALDPSDGRVRWERDTSLDLDEDLQPAFRDVDTTPVIRGDTIYIASYSGGLYALDRRNGSVQWRDPERTGIVGLALDPSGEHLVASSGDELAVLGLPDREVRWSRPMPRGTATTAVTHRGLIVVGASEGSLVALRMSDGGEVGRLDSGEGFSAPPATALARGFALSNGGTLFAFEL
ncbi:MAG: PQQ-binding-like beta-propeller repeat protein [Myxococcota bacterium]